MLPRSSMLNPHQAHVKAYFKRLGRRQDRHAANLDLAIEARIIDLSAPIATSAAPSPSAPSFEGATAFCAGRAIYQHMPIVKVRKHRHPDLAQGEF